MTSPTSLPTDSSHRTPAVPLQSASESIGLEHHISGVRRWRQNRKSRHNPLHDRNPQLPYQKYVQRLVAAGWKNLEELDTYMSHAALEEPGLIVSILDITHDSKTRRWPDITSEPGLAKFLNDSNRDDVNVRLYLTEYSTKPSRGIIEAFGAAFKLDPRFFNWSIDSKGHVFTPSQRHRAPYINLRFGILNASTPGVTDTENSNVLVYVQPQEDGKGWTGILFFNSHTRVDLSYRIITDPPSFASPLPLPTAIGPKSFREFYLESFESLSIPCIVSSPFYAISTLLRLNCFCWNQIITTIREEDHRINGISDASVGRAEEIQKNLALVERGGSLGWFGREDQTTTEMQAALEEDFKHLAEQTKLLWQTREKMKSIRDRKSETRWTSLTNAFTYLFAPVTIISGIYGMNVSQISGDSVNPNIWQFFVAVAVLNFLVLLALALSNWIHIQIKHGRAAGIKEVLKLAVGRI